jgi:hypothetical protein
MNRRHRVLLARDQRMHGYGFESPEIVCGRCDVCSYSIFQFSNTSNIAPSNAGTNTSVRHVIFSSANLFTMTSAIFSKLCVANAKMVGPAPERQIPSNPGCEFGVTDARISGNPGI